MKICSGCQRNLSSFMIMRGGRLKVLLSIGHNGEGRLWAAIFRKMVKTISPQPRSRLANSNSTETPPRPQAGLDHASHSDTSGNLRICHAQVRLAPSGGIFNQVGCRQEKVVMDNQRSISTSGACSDGLCSVDWVCCNWVSWPE